MPEHCTYWQVFGTSRFCLALLQVTVLCGLQRLFSNSFWRQIKGHVQNSSAGVAPDDRLEWLGKEAARRWIPLTRCGIIVWMGRAASSQEHEWWRPHRGLMVITARFRIGFRRFESSRQPDSISIRRRPKFIEPDWSRSCHAFTIRTTG